MATKTTFDSAAMTFVAVISAIIRPKWMGLFLVGALLASSHTVRAERLGPGTFNGYFHHYRWGTNVLHLGPYHLFVSDGVAKQLAEHRGKPLQVEVSEVSQPTNPGAGLIAEVKSVKEIPCSLAGVSLVAKLDADRSVQGAGITVNLTVQNKSKESVTLRPEDMALSFVTDSPHPQQNADFKDPDDRAYWYYSYGYVDWDAAPRIEKVVCCHEIILKELGKPLSSRGEKSEEQDRGQGYATHVTIEPGGWHEAKYVIAKDLSPDQYELFCYVKTGNLSSQPGPMTERLPFDIVERETSAEAKLAPAQTNAEKP